MRAHYSFFFSFSISIYLFFYRSNNRFRWLSAVHSQRANKTHFLFLGQCILSGLNDVYWPRTIATSSDITFFLFPSLYFRRHKTSDSVMKHWQHNRAINKNTNKIIVSIGQQSPVQWYAYAITSQSNKNNISSFFFVCQWAYFAFYTSHWLHNGQLHQIIHLQYRVMKFMWAFKVKINERKKEK